MKKLEFDGSEIFVIHKVDGKWYVGGYNEVWTDETQAEREAIIEDVCPFDTEHFASVIDWLLEALTVTK